MAVELYPSTLLLLCRLYCTGYSGDTGANSFVLTNVFTEKAHVEGWTPPLQRYRPPTGNSGSATGIRAHTDYRILVDGKPLSVDVFMANTNTTETYIHIKCLSYNQADCILTVLLGELSKWVCFRGLLRGYPFPAMNLLAGGWILVLLTFSLPNF